MGAAEHPGTGDRIRRANDIPGGAGWERLFWLLFNQTTHPVGVLDEDRKFVDLNDATLGVFGRSRGELIGTSIIDLIDKSQHARSAEAWEELLRTGELDDQRIFIRGDDTKINLHFSARLARIGERRLAVYVIVPQSHSWSLKPSDDESGKGLTDREREIVTLIALGRETNQIADELHISSETVRTHVRNAMGKLGVHTRAELVAVALCTEDTIDILRLGY